MAQGSSGKGKSKNKAKVKDESSGEDYPPLYAPDTPERDIPEAHDAEALDAEALDDSSFSSISPHDLVAAADEHFLRSSPSEGLESRARGGKKNAYVVYHGWKTGVFGSWAATVAQIRGFRGSSQEGFTSIEDANRAWTHALAIGAVQVSDGQPNVRRFSPPISRPGSRVPYTSTPPRRTKVFEQPPSRKKAPATVAAFGTVPPSFLLPAASSQHAPPAQYAPFACPSGRDIPSISNPGRASLRSNYAPKASGSRIASSTSRGASTLPSTRIVGDPWYVVLRGQYPGTYADRSTAMAALGQGTDLALERVATRELAYELFTTSFMEELVFVSAV